MTLTKNQRKADSRSRCLTTKWWTRSAASHLIETWNTRWSTPWTPAKTAREERSRLRRLKPEKTTGVLRNFLILFCPVSYFQGSADQESYLRNENLSEVLVKACKEWQQWKAVVLWNVTQFFAVVNLFSRPCGYFTFPISGNTMLRYEQQTLTTLFCKLKSDFRDVKSFEFVLCPLTTCSWQELTA